MKKIILFFIICILGISSVFAETTVTIEGEKKEINIGEKFSIKININTDSGSNIEVLDIGGIDVFTNLGKKQSKQTQIINEKISSKISLNLLFQGNEYGEYQVGPVKIKDGDSIIESNIITLTIGKNNINEAKKNIISETDSQKDKGNNIDEKRNNISDMKDIHGIKDIEITFDKIQFRSIYLFLLTIFTFYILYILLNKILELSNIRKNNILDEKSKTEDIKQEKEKIYKAILALSENMEDMNKDEYYANLNYLFRRYFVYLGVKNAYKMTLKELKNKQIDKKLFDIFTQSYINEFSESEDNLSIRKQISMNFMIYLKK